ncbi:hypothetical protein C0Q70_01902 [Pomacea canaliculata]|uniref:Uncharacterized protein n=1 Tax=Pomacea canaliculata TaxID=400727 RepID=A0A2T7Q0S4_POMCA|nr:hypothetical protein C0Q70_01902 [Pomacea canaliculata]
MTTNAIIIFSNCSEAIVLSLMHLIADAGSSLASDSASEMILATLACMPKTGLLTMEDYSFSNHPLLSQ